MRLDYFDDTLDDDSADLIGDEEQLMLEEVELIRQELNDWYDDIVDAGTDF